MKLTTFISAALVLFYSHAAVYGAAVDRYTPKPIKATQDLNKLNVSQIKELIEQGQTELRPSGPKPNANCAPWNTGWVCPIQCATPVSTSDDEASGACQ